MGTTYMVDGEALGVKIGRLREQGTTVVTDMTEVIVRLESAGQSVIVGAQLVMVMVVVL